METGEIVTTGRGLIHAKGSLIFLTCLIVFSSSELLAGDRDHSKLVRSYVNPNPAVFDGFGHQIAVNSEYIIIGAPHDQAHNLESGKVYKFSAETGQLEFTFSHPAPIGEELFGQSVMLQGHGVLIGAPRSQDRDGGRTGAVFLFHAQTGELLQTFQNPHPWTGVFGHAVAMQDRFVLIGDPRASMETAFYTGAAFLFDRQTGKLLHTFWPSDFTRGKRGRFGHAVSFVGNDIAVAAPVGGKQPEDSGLVYLYDGESWELRDTLSAPKPMTHDYFGWSIAGKPGRLLVGALGQNGAPPESGVAFLFHSGSGELIRSLVVPTLRAGDHFGEAVAMFSGLIGIGAPGHDGAGVDAGAVFIFDESDDERPTTLTNPVPETGAADLFGFSLSGNSSALFISAPFGGTKRHSDVGVVHQFQLNRVGNQDSPSK